jgi:hypothetical protein
MSRTVLALLALTLAASGCGPATSGESPPTSGSGVAGIVVAEPGCPVQAEPPSEPNDCTPRPVRADVDVRAVRTGSVVASVPTSADGHFRVALAPGGYELLARDPAGTMAGIPLYIEIRPNEWAEATVVVDSGVR